MYERFFALQQRPFSLLPDPDFLFLGNKHRAAIDLLELAVLNQCGFCVISGEVGAGKTVLVRELLQRLGDELRVGLVTNTHAGFGELMQWITAAFGLRVACDDRLELHRQFVDFVIQRYAAKQRTLLIIDEAQNLSAAAMEELRMLSNLNSDKDLVLQVILVGQPELRDKLAKPELAQFAQRIAVDYHLSALDATETCQYIAHRLSCAGGAGSLFEVDACLKIYRASGGVPRLINRICDLGMVYAFAQESQVVTPEIVAAVLRDQDEGGVFESVQQSAPAPGGVNPAVMADAAAARATAAPAAEVPDGLPEAPQCREDAGSTQTADNTRGSRTAGLSGQAPETGRAASDGPATVPAVTGHADPGDLSSDARYRPAPASSADFSESAAASPARQLTKPVPVTGESIVTVAHPASGLHRLVVDAERRRQRSPRRGAALAVSLALLVTAAAGWLNRERLPELYSGLMGNLPRLSDPVVGLAAVVMSRSDPGLEPATPSPGGRIVSSGTGARFAVPVYGPDPASVANVAGEAPLEDTGPQDDRRNADYSWHEDPELQREVQRLEKLKRDFERLARQRHAAAQQLATERRAGEIVEARARLERERIRAAQRGVAGIAAERRRLAEQPVPAPQDDTARRMQVGRQPVAASSPAASAWTSTVVESEQTVTAIPRQVSPPVRQSAADLARRQADRFVPNPCNGLTAKFMTTCF